MVQIIPRNQPTFGERISAGITQGVDRGSQYAGMAMENAMQQKSKLADMQRKQQFAQQIMDDPALEGLPLATRRLLANEAAGLTSAQATKATLNSLREVASDDRLGEILGDGSGGLSQGQSSDSLGMQSDQNLDAPSRSTGRNYEGEIQKWQKILADRDPRNRDFAKAKIEELRRQQEIGRKQFIDERNFQTQFSKPIEEKVANLREAIPRKESALNLARSSIENGDLSFFSKDKLADFTGIDAFRTAKGAQLVTAGKESLLNNMGRVSAKAQNIWFEQRLNSMFPKIGQSNEANLTIQEMIEGELAMDKLYQETFDRLTSQDEENFGYVKKDIDKRTHQSIKEKEKEIFNRTSHRIKELEEQEKGLEKATARVGKNVVKGTPLTLGMAKLYKDKYGQNAFQIAKKNGYYIPTLEEFQLFQQRPQEFREGFEE